MTWQRLDLRQIQSIHSFTYRTELFSLQVALSLNVALKTSFLNHSTILLKLSRLFFPDWMMKSYLHISVSLYELQK